MNKRRLIAIILEIVPIISAISFYLLLISPLDSAFVRVIISVTMFIAISGVAFFFIGRKVGGKGKAVLILGIFDILSTVFVIGVYTLVAFLFGL